MRFLFLLILYFFISDVSLMLPEISSSFVMFLKKESLFFTKFLLALILHRTETVWSTWLHCFLHYILFRKYFPRTYVVANSIYRATKSNTAVANNCKNFSCISQQHPATLTFLTRRVLYQGKGRGRD